MDKKYVSIVIDKELYGIDIMMIDSIVRMQPITRIPGARDYFPGVINLRGDVVPILSLRKRFGLVPDEFTNKTRMIILKPEGRETVGFIVDEVSEVLLIGEDDVDIIKDSSKEGNFSTGIARTSVGLVSLINVGAVLQE